MDINSEETIVDNGARQRLLFPSWSIPKQRRTRQRRKGLLRNTAALFVAALTIWGIVALTTHFHDAGTDTVLGKALSAYDIAALGLPPNSSLGRAAPPPANNPWRGAGNRRRGDLLSSVSGCGGTYRPSLRGGDMASVYYVVRGSNGTIDSTRDGAAVDVVLGSGQVGADVETRLEGMCAGETVAFRSGERSFVVHVARIGAVQREDLEARELERLAHVLKGVPAARGVACGITCHRAGLRCAAGGFRIVNSCPRLREAFRCRACETAAAGSSGPDMPCYVEMSAPLGHPRGFCMVNPKVHTATCQAKYVHTRRLCPCVPEGVLRADGEK